MFDATDGANRNQVLAYAQKMSKNGKKISLLGFVNNKQKDLELSDDFIRLLAWVLTDGSFGKNRENESKYIRIKQCNKNN